MTSVYLDGIDRAEIIDTVHNRRPPMISATAGLQIWGNTTLLVLSLTPVVGLISG
jgi:hypothetical protein